MFSTFRTVSLRYLQRRWFRALLIVASIALGVATLVATQALNDTMSRAVLGSTNPMAGKVDFVVGNGELTVAKELIPALASVPGVRSVEPRVFRNAYLPDLQKNVLVLGIDLTKSVKEFSDPKWEFSLGPGTMDRYMGFKATALLPKLLRQIPVVTGKALADALEAKGVGYPFLQLRRDPRDKVMSLANAGYIAAKGDLAALGGFVLILDLPDAAEVLGLTPDQANRLDIALEPGAKVQTVRAELEKRLAGKARLSTPEEHNRAKQSAMSGMQTGFSLCGLAALVVGVFLVYNSLAVSVAERRHEIGILLSLGATRSMVLRLFAGEAAVLGLIGSLLGLPLGVALAYLGMPAMQDVLKDIFGDFNADTIELSWSLIALALSAGFLTAVVAAVVPAWSASRENPAAAVRRIDKAPSARKLVTQAILSATLVMAGLALILLRHHISHRIGTYGGLTMVLVGALTASPFFAAIFARMIQPFVSRYLSIEWRLAADNLVRAPGRTGLVIGALAAGVSLVVQTAGTIRSNRQALKDWIDDSFAADLVVTSGGLVSAGQVLDMDESLGAELEKLPNITYALPVRQVHGVRYKDTTICLIGIDSKLNAKLERDRFGPSADNDLTRKLSETPGSAIMSENFAALHHVRVGDTIQVGGATLHIIGQMVDYSWNHGSLQIDRGDLKRLFNDPKVTAFDIHITRGADPKAAKDVINLNMGAQYQLHALTRTELQRHIDGMIDRLYGIAYGQQVVVMLVAALGVVMALLISVLQRRRELGMLRAIGASRGQVIYSVLAEACLMGVIGTVIGLCVGIPLQWYVLQVVILEESGYLFPVHIPWSGGLMIAASATTLATLAGLGPALHAVRQRIPDAIAYE